MQILPTYGSEGVRLVLVDQNNTASATSTLGGVLGQLASRIGIQTIVFATAEDEVEEVANTTTVQITDTDAGLNIQVIEQIPLTEAILKSPNNAISAGYRRRRHSSGSN